MTALPSLLRKETDELLRDLRLPVYATLYTLVMGIITYFILQDARDAPDVTAGGTVPGALAIAIPIFFFNILSLLLLAATFVFDAVGKERDAGMLGLILTSRASPAEILLAKVAFGLLVYLLAAALGLLAAAVLSLSLGGVVVEALLLCYAGPLLVLYVFMLGTGLLASVLAPSARLAVALGLGLDFPLFLLGATPVFADLLRAAPAVDRFMAWTPFAAARDGMQAILLGGETPWSAYLVTLGVGLAALAAAFVVFHRQEVAQG